MKWQTLCGSQGHAFEFSISTKLNSFLSYLFATVGFMLFCIVFFVVSYKLICDYSFMLFCLNDFDKCFCNVKVRIQHNGI